MQFKIQKNSSNDTTESKVKNMVKVWIDATHDPSLGSQTPLNYLP